MGGTGKPGPPHFSKPPPLWIGLLPVMAASIVIAVFVRAHQPSRPAHNGWTRIDSTLLVNAEGVGVAIKRSSTDEPGCLKCAVTVEGGATARTSECWSRPGDCDPPWTDEARP